jgi:hypothetical protein
MVESLAIVDGALTQRYLDSLQTAVNALTPSALIYELA